MDAVQRAVFWGFGRTTYRFDSVQALHIAYAEEHERQQLDLYLPKHEAPSACVMFVHGGTWKSGHKDDYAFVGQTLAAHGIATAVVGYRLFPEVKFPEFTNDVAQALGWLQRNGEQHGVNIDQGVVMIGHSAGAHLASLVALDPIYSNQFGFSPSFIQGVIGLAGIYSFRPENSELMSEIFQPAASPNDFFEAKPINYLKGGGVPLYLMHGRKDQTVVCQSAERMFKNAMLAGHPVDIHVEEKYGHVRPLLDFLSVMPNHRRFMKKITGFIDEVLNENTGNGSNRVHRAALRKTFVQSS